MATTNSRSMGIVDTVDVDMKLVERKATLLATIMDLEEQRVSVARPEVNQITALQSSLHTALAGGGFTPAQIVSMYQEIRRCIELRAQLSGALTQWNNLLVDLGGA